ncbi:ArnT family glycosyltransferase [Synechococcus sp. CCY9202]|uniref:ArnT family glycosyltransferase n=1 Tax=Synechococcus sp. CCY9202 TaxID=174698 RepID=UPI002B21A72F|nr:glycosyltransferase family 39 protein [Synechococcus sp. CCY9202]MEA5424772.1 glycosyltransferase family 39 protein [Synechococcus sp. CCY9202]
MKSRLSVLEDQPIRLALLAIVGLIGLCWLAFFNGLGSLGLMDKTEALFVEVGHQMLLRNDWVTPWWNDSTFFDYPVWGYWMVALSFRLFGVSEAAARLPVAVAASAVVLATFGLLLLWAPAAESRLKAVARAGLAAGVLATTPAWIGWGRTSTTDMFLSSAITLALFSYLVAERDPSNRRLIAMGRVGMACFAGIAVLAKGPVGLLLPAIVIGADLLVRGHWSRWLRPFPLAAMTLLFCGIALPWYAAATAVHGQAFLGGFLGFSNLERFTSVLYDHPGPPWFYLPWLLLLLLPWSPFLPQAIARAAPWPLARARQADAPALPAILLLWLVLIVAFFSAAATKLPGYILPAIPAASLLVALLWHPLSTDRRDRQAPPTWAFASWLNIALLAGGSAAAALAPSWVSRDPAFPQFAAALSASGLPQLLAVLLGLAALVGLALMLGRRNDWIWLPNLAGFLAVLFGVVAPLGPLLDRERQLPLRELQQLAGSQSRPDEPLWVVGTMRYSTLFYGGRSAVFLGDASDVKDLWKQDPSLLAIQPASVSALLLGDRHKLDGFALPADRIERLGQRGVQELWRVSLDELRPRKRSRNRKAS